MIEIVADMTVHPPHIELNGAPASSLAEIRAQNLMTGHNNVLVVETDAAGRAFLEVPDFADYFNVYVQILDTNNTEEVLHLVYSRACDAASLHLITEAAYAQMLTEQPAPPPPEIPVIPVIAELSGGA